LCKLRFALVGVLVILALAAEVKFPIEEYLVDTLLRGLDNKRNAFSFHTHYITGIGSCCQALFIEFLADVILYQSLLHLGNSIAIALITKPYRAVAPTQGGRKVT